MKAKKAAAYFGWFLFTAFLAWFCIISLATGKANITSHGFGIDDQGKVYIGNSNDIFVYSNQSLQYKINAMTSRGYFFRIEEDQTIHLSTSTEVYTIALDGEVLSMRIDNDHTYEDLKSGWRKQEFNNSSYQYSTKWGRYEIVKTVGDEKEVIFRMPVFDYIIKLCLLVFAISLILFIPTIIVKVRKSKIFE